jgi:hypothetical protein
MENMMSKTSLVVLLATVIILALVLVGVFGISKIIPGDRTTVTGSGNVVEEARTVNRLTGVNLATIGHLIIALGDTESLRIEAEDNLMEHLETQERGGTLRIGTQADIRLDATKPINYYLTVTNLDSIQISSVGDIKAPDLQAEQFSIVVSSSGNLAMGNLETDALTVKISSSGDVTMGKLNAGQLDVDIGSTGNLDIAGGEVKTQTVNISSAGNFTAQDLVSDEAEARLSSDGSATIWVKDHLKATLNSSGDLRYRGDPTVEATTNSSGDVVQITQ